jgi:hypothetical protein
MSITIAWSTPGNLAPWIEGTPISIQLVAGSNLTGSIIPVVNMGTIVSPNTQNLNFGSISTPSSLNLNFGLIFQPVVIPVGAIIFNIISGSLPTGVSMSSTGLLSGTPLGNQSYKFVVRASITQAGITAIADRTFYLNVVGNAPIVNFTVTLPDQYDVVEYSYQVVAVDIDIQDQLTYRIVSGSLPRSLTMSSSGLISGLITRQLSKRFTFTVAVTDGTYTETQNYILTVINRPSTISVAPIILNRAGDIGTFRVEDQFSHKIDGSLDGIKESTGLTYSLVSGTLPPGLSLRSNTGWIDGFLDESNFPPLGKTTYTFSIRVANGSTVGQTKTFSITIDSDAILNALSSWNVPAELGSLRLGSISRFDINPYAAGPARMFRIKPTANLITSNSDALDGGSWTGYCYSGSTWTNTTYNTTDVAAPNGTFTATKLVRDSSTVCGGGGAWGLIWSSGNVTLGVTYTISMWVYAPTIINGCLFGFNDNWGGTFNITPTWTRVTYTGVLTDPGNGLRGFQFIMPAGSGTAYFWGAQLEAGSFARPYASWPTGTREPGLPPNLLLRSNGLITGRVSFLGTNSTPSNLVGVYTFTAEMINYRGAVIGTKEFTIRTLYQAPYEKIYLQAFPRLPQRKKLTEFLNDSSIIPKSYVYRLEDANFGIVSDFKLLGLTGLRPTDAEYYVAAMVKNHLRKAAYIREFRLAVARDLVTTRPIYEVIYGILEDNKQLAYETVTLQRSSKHPLKINNTVIDASYGGIISADQQSVVKVFPNSFDNMRSAMGRSLAFAATDVLPEWATSLQADGVTVGYSNVLPLVYVQVGRGEEILDNIAASRELFNLIPFDIDGYVWEDFVQPRSIGVNEIATSGLTTKYLAFPRTGLSKYSG